uniref:Uncharacterized protein n=1 Tax=Anguilla anguilla TaxID=7936 RepID=A0A0E9R2G8_ANGAN
MFILSCDLSIRVYFTTCFFLFNLSLLFCFIDLLMHGCLRVEQKCCT